MAEERVSRTDGSEGRALMRDGKPCAVTGLKFGDVERMLAENPATVRRECRIAYREGWNAHPYKPYSVFLCYFPETSVASTPAILTPVLDFCRDNGQPVERIRIEGQVMLKNADGSFGKFVPNAADEKAKDWIVEIVKQANFGDDEVPADNNER